MKFAIAAVVTLALAMGVESSVYPWGPATVAGHGLSYTAVSGPAYAHAWPHGPAAVAVHETPAWPAWHGAAAWAPSPALVVSAPHWAAHAPAIVHAPAHEGHYVAKTRGAVHSAPLAGHAASAASINLAPAPGTI